MSYRECCSSWIFGKLTPEVHNEICKKQETLGRHEWKGAGI